MTRRNFIALVSLCVFVALGLIVIGLGVFATQSEYGQDTLRRAAEARVKSAILGKVHLGRIHGNLLTGATIDSLELRDEEDSLFVATGPISVEYDPRDLIDRRLWFRKVNVQHPVIVLRQHENWKWNYRKVLKLGGPQKKNQGPERGFSDFVVLDSVHISQGASFRLTLPWHADDSLRGVKRDSAIRANIGRTDHEIRRTREGFTQTYRWDKAYAFLPHIRIADPDSVGQLFLIDTLHVAESTPPFLWRNIKGQAYVHADSAWFTASHFDLPASTGRANGKVVWGSDLPVRYAVHVIGDSVSMADVAWVYPTLPTTGSGKMVLDIRNESNLNLLDYAITDMDVRSTKSRLRGNMTFEIGGLVLGVHDVKLVADPVDFDLLRTLNGKPFPADWQGTLTGTVTARGGPVTHFVVDGSDFTFRDAHVPGAVSHLQGHGELDILFPAFTAFHNFSARTDRLELRTLSAIYPSFPRMTGIVAGSAVLDSSWLDVRVSNAELTHTDGPAEPSHATGGGRITYGIPFMSYDLTLQASPLSLTTLAESYPKFPLRGVLSGPVRVRGTADNLDVSADLAGPAGHIFYTGKADADSIGGYGAKGTGTIDSLNVAALFGKTTPATSLNGSYETDILGDSLANLDGSVAVRLEKSLADSIGISQGIARLRFDRGVLLVDTARFATVVGVLQARGALGLMRAPGSDSLAFAIDADSLGGLRRYLASALSAGHDSLTGALSIRGAARGMIDTLDVRGTLHGRSIVVGTSRSQDVSSTFAIGTAKEHVFGTVTAHADTAVVGGIRLDTASVGVRVRDVGDARFAVGARVDNGALVRGSGDWHAVGDTTQVRVDTLDMTLGTANWALRRPSLFSTSPRGITLDTLLFANATGARIAGYLRAPTDAPATGRFVADSLPLADVGAFAQLPEALSGALSVALTIGGTKDAPTLTLGASASALKYAGLATDLVRIDGDYASKRLALRADLQRGGRSILDGTLSYPVALTLFSASATDDSLRGRLHADSVDLALVEALMPKVKSATGHLALDLAISGVSDQPHVGGRMVVTKGGIEVPDYGLKLSDIEGLIRVDAAHDSVAVERLAWTSPASNGTATLGGSVVFRDRAQPKLDLRLDAQSFRAVDKRGLARLDVSTGAGGLALRGTPEAATLSGSVDVDRGTIYIPELVRKQIVDLTPDEFAQLYDTTDVRNRSLMPQPPSALVEHLELRGVAVRLGEDVWLRSREASIKLGGSLNVTRVIDDRDVTRASRTRAGKPDSARYKLALSGSLSADRGTYTLDLTAVQREFQVQSGRITFFGTPDFNPEIDVSAQYSVKQSNRADIGIRARIHGNFYPQPQLELSSTDAYLSPSDLVSYLVTGQPSFERTADVGTQQRAFEFLVPTVGASVSRALREQLGGVVDLIQIQSGAYDPLGASTGGQFRSILSSTRLGGEKQISDKLFFSFSTGLCQLGGSTADASQQGFTGFVNAIEGKLEYRFPTIAPDKLALRAGREPAAAALRCSAQQVRGFVPTPEQWGFSLFRSWSF